MGVRRKTANMMGLVEIGRRAAGRSVRMDAERGGVGKTGVVGDGGGDVETPSLPPSLPPSLLSLSLALSLARSRARSLSLSL